MPRSAKDTIIRTSVAWNPCYGNASRFHPNCDSTVLVTYHPSYLLRNPSAKKYVWDDMQMLLKEMGLPIPGKS